MEEIVLCKRVGNCLYSAKLQISANGQADDMAGILRDAKPIEAEVRVNVLTSLQQNGWILYQHIIHGEAA